MLDADVIDIQMTPSRLYYAEAEGGFSRGGGEINAALGIVSCNQFPAASKAPSQSSFAYSYNLSADMG